MWSEYHTCDDYLESVESPDVLMVGYKSEDALLYGIDLRQTYCYLISGSPRSGKKNYLKVVLQAALEKVADVCVIDSPDNILSAYSEEENLSYINSERGIFDYFNKLAPEFVRRNKIKKELVAKDAEEDEIFNTLS